MFRTCVATVIKKCDHIQWTSTENHLTKTHDADFIKYLVGKQKQKQCIKAQMMLAIRTKSFEKHINIFQGKLHAMHCYLGVSPIALMSE